MREINNELKTSKMKVNINGEERMILTKKQEQGLKLCIEKYLNHERYCVISGYAVWYLRVSDSIYQSRAESFIGRVSVSCVSYGTGTGQLSGH